MTTALAPRAGEVPAQRVTEAARIGHLLMRLVETRAALTLRVEGAGPPCNSVALALDLRRNRLAIDAPFPDCGLAPGMDLHLRGRVEGSEVDFSSRVADIARHLAEPVVYLDVPQEVEHRERRERYRVNVTSDLRLPPATFTGRDGVFRARLTDISESGAGGFAAISDAPVQVGAVLSCVLSLPDTRLIADVQVRSVVREPGGRRFGFRFTGLDAAQTATLMRAVASLDRQLLRRYASASWV